jgi:membrane-associated phospholipid phosphatase
MKQSSAEGIDIPVTFPARWRLPGLLIFNALAVALLLSWLWEPTRTLWDLFDDALFVDLNLRLSDARPWARFWAFMNLRPVDILSGLAMLPFILRPGFIFPAAKVRAALLSFIALLFLALVLRVSFDFGVVKPLEMSRSSPSLTVPGSVRLSELFPDWAIPVKDASVTSFPGDHASIALVWALLLSIFARGWRLAAVWGVTAVLLLPRLVAGAHWGSDDFVGGLFVACLSIGWGCYTPYASWMQRQLERMTTPLREALAALPGLGRLTVMR